MNIILLSNRRSTAVSIGPRQLWLALAALTLLAVALGVGIGMALGGGGTAPRLWPLIKPLRQAELDTLAIKLGELQARLIRLDGLAQQVGTKAGIEVKPYLTNQPAPPRGGPDTRDRPLSAAELLDQVNAANDRANGYIGQFSLAESMLLRPTNTALPTLAPLTAGLQSSSFGWRIDPFNGHQAFHEGLDFAVPSGTPIRAAGAGTVVYAGFHPQYGNMAEIDHGNNLTSRYAHSSKLLVKVGDHVQAGQIIADVGSTGRSTGPHLHFEIRYKGVAQNPLRFLAQNTIDTASNQGPND